MDINSLMKNVDMAVSNQSWLCTVDSNVHCLCKECLQHDNTFTIDLSNDCYLYTTGLTEFSLPEIIVFLGPNVNELPIDIPSVIKRSDHAANLIRFVVEQLKGGNNFTTITPSVPLFVFGDRIFTIERDHRVIESAKNLMKLCGIRYDFEFNHLVFHSIGWVH